MLCLLMPPTLPRSFSDRPPATVLPPQSSNNRQMRISPFPTSGSGAFFVSSNNESPPAFSPCRASHDEQSHQRDKRPKQCDTGLCQPQKNQTFSQQTGEILAFGEKFSRGGIGRKVTKARQTGFLCICRVRLTVLVKQWDRGIQCGFDAIHHHDGAEPFHIRVVVKQTPTDRFIFRHVGDS